MRRGHEVNVRVRFGSITQVAKGLFGDYDVSIETAMVILRCQLPTRTPTCQKMFRLCFSHPASETVVVK